MGHILISYRRTDAEGEAGRLHSDLSSKLKYHAVDIDVDAFEPGEDFVTGIEALLSKTDILLVLIGPRWPGLSESDETSRLQAPSDFVRLEISLAFAKGVRVIPVLIRDAKMPSSEDLPSDIRPLLRLNAFQLSHARWNKDVEELASWLNRYLVVANGDSKSSERQGQQDNIASIAADDLKNELNRLNSQLAESKREISELRRFLANQTDMSEAHQDSGEQNRRLELTYETSTGSKKGTQTLPFRLLFIGDFIGRIDNTSVEKRKVHKINADNFFEIMSAYSINLSFEVPNRVPHHSIGAYIKVQLRFSSIDDFSPEAIVNSIPALDDELELRKAISALSGLSKENRAFREAIEEATAQMGEIREERSTHTHVSSKSQHLAESSDARKEKPNNFEMISDNIMSTTVFHPGEPAHSYLIHCIDLFLRNGERFHHLFLSDRKSWLTNSINEIDSVLSDQINEVLHHKDFQNMESAWRGLWYALSNRGNPRHTEFHLLNVSKNDLLRDLSRKAVGYAVSGFSYHLYDTTYMSFDGQPFAAVIGNYFLGSNTDDIQLLRQAAEVASSAHTLFIVGASPKFFGLDDFTKLHSIRRLQELYERPELVEWVALREDSNSNYLGLTLPRFLLRRPYGEFNEKIKAFQLEENITEFEKHLLWGNASFAFASRLARSYSMHGVSINLTGASDGLVGNLPVAMRQHVGTMESLPITEALITDRQEFELAEAGFIPLAARPSSGNAAFFSANSVRKAKRYGGNDSKELELKERLMLQLPYLLYVSRFMQCLKVLHRESGGTWSRPSIIEAEFRSWLMHYIANQENPPEGVIIHHPLRFGDVSVTQLEARTDVFRASLTIRPSLKYYGGLVELSLDSWLEKR